MKKSTKKLIRLVPITLTLITVLVCVGVLYAWFIIPKEIVVKTGDVKFSVKGYYSTAGNPLSLTYDNELKTQADYDKINAFYNITSSELIGFRFEVTNQSDVDMTLRLRFSDYSEYIFSQFNDYLLETEQVELGLQTEFSPEFQDAFAQNAIKHAAKHLYAIDGVRVVEKIVGQADKETEHLATDRYLWKYAAGDCFLEGILIPRKQTRDVYFYFVNRQTSDSVTGYLAWLKGTQTTVGYGQTRLSHIKYGKDYEALTTAQQTYVNSYLNDFFLDEQVVFDSEYSENINLTLNYFEFIGENVERD